MKRDSLWPAVGAGTVVALALGGCATTGSVRAVHLEAQKAAAEGQRALAATKRIAAERRATDQKIEATLERLQGKQKELVETLAQVQAQERRQSLHPAEQRALVPRAPVSKALGNAVFAQVEARARALAAAPYKAPPKVAPSLQKLSFTDYGKLSYAGRVPGWPAGTPFHIQLYPAGYLFTWPETISVVSQGKTVSAPLPITVTGDPGLAHRIPKMVPPAGFSAYTSFGHGPVVNEFLSFLGASYFRAVGQGQSWGLSARGVAVDTALPHRAEEFPYFRAFWLVASHPGARHLVFCALLDSPSLTGAYRFVARPGKDTVVDVKAVLFERQHVRRLGIAPLTSMFLQGRFSHKRFDHLVRSAHDSDGLAIALPGNARMWWPLRDPSRIAIYRFPLSNPLGFGLMQRARRAGDYRAYGMHYEDRPSAWVTPEGNWGAGHILLVELPTNSETNDNISAFWVPQNQAAPLQPMTFHYRIAWQGQDPTGTHLAYVAAQRSAYNAAQRSETYVIDFVGHGLTRGAAPVTPHVHVFGPARVINPWVTRNAAGQWRLQFSIARTGAAPVVLHAALMRGNARVSETWANALILTK